MSNNTNKVKLFVLCMTVIFMAFIAFVLPRVANYTDEAIGDFDAPDTSFYYTSEELYNTAELYGEEGRSIYIKLRWTFDVIWPIVYTGFLMSWILMLTIKTKFRKLYFLPLIAMGFDLMENIGATIVFSNYPVKSNLFAFLTPWFSLFKWTTLSLSFLLWFCLILILSFKFIVKLLKK